MDIMVIRVYGISFIKCYNMLLGENRCCLFLEEIKYNMLYILLIKFKKKRIIKWYNNSLKEEIE